MIFNFIYNYEKENCECSNKYISKFIKYYSLITIILTILMMIYPKLKIPTIMFVYSIFGVVNIYLLFKFYQDIEKKECKCKQITGYDFLYYYSMILMAFFIVYNIILMIIDHSL